MASSRAVAEDERTNASEWAGYTGVVQGLGFTGAFLTLAPMAVFCFAGLREQLGVSFDTSLLLAAFGVISMSVAARVLGRV
jgi:hypothetical protein